MKRLAAGLVAVIVIVPAVALLAPVLVDLNDFKPDIARKVEAATGYRLAIGGDIEGRILPSPGRAVLRGIRLASRDGDPRRRHWRPSIRWRSISPFCRC